jgi:Zn finger protein HypA/HybF involved in hydrogenase expression
MIMQINSDILEQNHHGIVEHEEDHKLQELEHEIECPRCHDIMTLSAEFDSLYYICEGCDFSLYTIRKDSNNVFHQPNQS